MGNLFSGSTEGLLLYRCIPLLALALVVALPVLGTRVARGLRLHRDSWLGAPTPVAERGLHYRAPAASTGQVRVPSRVVWVAHAALLWGSGICAFWILSSVAMALRLGASLALVLPLATTILGFVACVRLVQASLALGDRHGASVLVRLDRARRWLLVHHLVVFTLATALLLLLLASNGFFWNGGSERRVRQLGELSTLYGIVVLVPSALGLGLSRGLRVIRALYRPERASAAA